MRMRGIVGRSVSRAGRYHHSTYTEDDSGKHTSVTKEASRAMVDLKKLRKAKDERAQRRVSLA